MNGKDYVSHPAIVRVHSYLPDSDFGNLFASTLSLEAVDYLIAHNFTDFIGAVQCEAAATCLDKRFAEHLAVMGLATGIGHPVMSVYPETEMPLRDLLNNFETSLTVCTKRN